jgi:hypothetical protein
VCSTFSSLCSILLLSCMAICLSLILAEVFGMFPSSCSYKQGCLNVFACNCSSTGVRTSPKRGLADRVSTHRCNPVHIAKLFFQASSCSSTQWHMTVCAASLLPITRYWKTWAFANLMGVRCVIIAASICISLGLNLRSYIYWPFRFPSLEASHKFFVHFSLCCTPFLFWKGYLCTFYLLWQFYWDIIHKSHSSSTEDTIHAFSASLNL